MLLNSNAIKTGSLQFITAIADYFLQLQISHLLVKVGQMVTIFVSGPAISPPHFLIYKWAYLITTPR